MSYIKQHDIGWAGLALLRNWLVGDEKVAKPILREIQELTKETINEYSVNSKKVTQFNVSEGYKAWADTYDSMPNLLLEVEEPIVKTLLKKIPSGTALDAACGTGRYSELLNSLGYKVTGMDLSSTMLSQARKTRNKKIDFIEGDLTAIPKKDKSLDLAVCALALTHLSNIERALSELKRVVRPGGYIILSDIHPLLVTLGGQAEFINKTGEHGYVLNHVHWHSNYINSFRNLNLKVIECIEPVLEPKHIKLAKMGSSLEEKTVAAALVGLPIALIWVLKRQ
jgi:ubiquinone/menaquinone biosynthesis C-methylase UbiE